MPLSEQQRAKLEEIAEEVSQAVADVYESDRSLAELMQDENYHGGFYSAPTWIQAIAEKNKSHSFMYEYLDVLVDTASDPMKDSLMDSFLSTIKKLDAKPGKIESYIFDLYTEAMTSVLDVVKEIKSQKDKHESSDEHVDSPVGGPLGKTAFSKNRLDDAPRNEPDMRAERELYDDLKDYVISNTPLKNAPGKTVQDLISTGKYPKIFKSPAAGLTVYRGMVVSEKWLAAALGAKEDEVPDSGEEETSFTYAPQGGSSSSWSRQKEAAQRFANRARGGKFAVVIHASESDNPESFLDMNDGLYNVTPMKRYSNEQEVMGIGDIKVFKLEWRKVT
jgi:hypothetical protein